MALTDTFVRNTKSDKPKGQKHADGDGMYLLVTPTGKYWRLDYRHLGKRKTLSLGAYPSITLAKARTRCADAKRLIAEGTDPAEAKREDKQGQIFAATQTFELVARMWMEKTAASRAESTRQKVTGWLQNDVFPYIGKSPVSTLKPRDVLVCVQHMEARGVNESAHRVKQIIGQVLRFAVATGLTERDVTADLKGALTIPVKGNYAAIIDPKPAGELMRAVYGYHGHAYAAAALKLSALLFVRPGELRNAEWREMDLDDAVWRIPAAKMKMRHDHLVPLSMQALEILRGLERMTGEGKYVFPSIRSDDRCMSENTVSAALRSMGYGSIKMGREAKITYEQVANAADSMCAANLRPSSRTVRERLGNTGSMGTINRLLQEWKATQERHIAQPLTLPPILQRTILDFMAQELATAKAQLESALAEQRLEMTDLAIENERQGTDIEERISAEVALRAELATLQGRMAQTEGELAHAKRETANEREEAAQARIDLAKALLRLEATPLLEADLRVLRADLDWERQQRVAATQRAAVLEAKLEAARERATQAEALAAEARNAVGSKDGGKRDTGRVSKNERRSNSGKSA